MRRVAHARGVLFLKHDHWIVHDVVRSQGPHRYDLWFHLDSGVDADLQSREGATKVQATAGLYGLEIASFGRNSSWQREEGSVSHCYAQGAVAPVYVFSTPASNDEDFLTFLLPERSRGVREVEAIGGRAFEIAGEGAHDILMIKTGKRAEMARLASDFDWTWARFAAEGATVPEELVLIGGQWLELGGREVLRSGRRINYLVASRIGDQFRIETDDGVLQLHLPISDFESALLSAKGEEPRAKGKG